MSTKIHAVVDEKGLPVRLSLTAGQAHDRRAVNDLLVELPPGADVVADRAYDSDGVLELIARAGPSPTSPQRAADASSARSIRPSTADAI